MLKRILLAATAVGLAVGAASAADAREGCGPGAHRGPYGHCRPNGGPGVRGPALVIGNFYNGRGYWDGRRYWQHRERHGRDWRYR